MKPKVDMGATWRSLEVISDLGKGTVGMAVHMSVQVDGCKGDWVTSGM